MSQIEALLLSIVLEVVCLVAVVRLAKWSEAPLARLATVGAAATLLSHPLVWHGSRALRPVIESFAVRATLTEVGAWLFEAALYAWLLHLTPQRALGVSLVANACSFGAGLLWVYVLAS